MGMTGDGADEAGSVEVRCTFIGNGHRSGPVTRMKVGALRPRSWPTGAARGRDGTRQGGAPEHRVGGSRACHRRSNDTDGAGNVNGEVADPGEGGAGLRADGQVVPALAGPAGWSAVTPRSAPSRLSPDEGLSTLPNPARRVHTEGEGSGRVLKGGAFARQARWLILRTDDAGPARPRYIEGKRLGVGALQR